MITIHGSWPSLNEFINAANRNRFIAAKMKQSEMERMQWQMKGTPPIQGKVDITLQAYVKNKRKDPDNIYTYALKLILDSLVGLGILKNDTQECIGRIVFEEVKIGEERMEVTLTTERRS
jgi:Holliday junction resolvase RusA-like endonuclease